MLIKDAKNQTWIVKFKYIPHNKERKIRYCKCPAVLSWVEMSTVCSVRKVEQSREEAISTEVFCKKSDLFKKYMGRQLSFVEMMDNPKVGLTDDDKTAFVKAYNEKFRHKIQIITDLCEDGQSSIIE